MVVVFRLEKVVQHPYSHGKERLNGLMVFEVDEFFS